MNLVEAGEQAGALETLLDKIATYKEKTEALKKKIKKALFYPAAVLVVAVIVTVILLIFVIPQFESLFKGFGADLPAFTQMVIDMSRWMQREGLVCSLIVVGARGLSRSSTSTSARDRCASSSTGCRCKMPDHRPDPEQGGHRALRAHARRRCSPPACRWSRRMKSVAGATGNIVYEDAVLRMRDEVATGQRLQRAMENTGLFPNMVVQMIAVGEESGSLDEMSGKVADFYEADVDAAVDGMSSLLEPLIMVILGVLVGGLVIAMYLPIFKLGAVV